MRVPRASLLLLGLLSGLLRCTNTTDATTTTTTTTTTTETTALGSTVTVLPESFLGVVPCSNNPGAMRSYVVTLTDTTTDPSIRDGGLNFDLPSSLPTPCSQPVVFAYVVIGHQYTATIDGYELPADQLTPSFYASSGSRTMLLKKDSSPASPRWTNGTQGNLGCTPVTATDATNVNVTRCSPLEDHGSSAPMTGIRVDVRGALGLLACSKPDNQNGTIGAFNVYPDDPLLAQETGLACDTGEASYTSGIQDGVLYTFTIVAHTDDKYPQRYRASCSAKARTGLIVAATCSPLVLF